MEAASHPAAGPHQPIWRSLRVPPGIWASRGLYQLGQVIRAWLAGAVRQQWSACSIFFHLVDYIAFFHHMANTTFPIYKGK